MEVKFDMEGQAQSSPKTIGTLRKCFASFRSNQVILAGTCDELSRGQAKVDRHRYTHTDRGNDNTRGPRVING